MKITDKIKDYENLTPEEKLKALEEFEFEEKPVVDEEAIKLKNLLSKANSEASSYKKKWQETLSEQEQNKLKTEELIQSLKEQNEMLEKEKKVGELKSQYLGLGYSSELATETATAFMEGDNQKVFANHKKFLELREASIKKELLEGTAKPPAGDKPENVTKEQFNKMSYTERSKLYNENRELYDKLNGGK